MKYFPGHYLSISIIFLPDFLKNLEESLEVSRLDSAPMLVVKDYFQPSTVCRKKKKITEEDQRKKHLHNHLYYYVGTILSIDKLKANI